MNDIWKAHCQQQDFMVSKEFGGFGLFNGVERGFWERSLRRIKGHGIKKTFA